MKMAPAAEAAWEAVLGMGLAMLIGYYLDRWLGSEPWFFFGMLVIGVAAAFRRLFQLSKAPPPGDPPEDPS
jgi:F0F1-type ATP synthase assembly protein I